MKSFSLTQKLAWFFAVNFLLVFIICHWPGFTDATGHLFGLFFIDPIDDVIHLLSAVAAAVAAWKSAKWSRVYFKFIGIPYGLDALTGLLFHREFLNLDVFTHGLGSPNFSIPNILINGPHIIILLSAVWIGFFMKDKELDGPRA